jgi:CheY-like chemotaxis protein
MGAGERDSILVVDDDGDACEVLAAALDQAGFGVKTSLDPLEALALVATYAPDLVLTDLQMPAMDGVELIRRIGSSGRKVRAVLMTGTDTRDLCTGAHAYGAEACLVKPIDLDQLIWTIECALACRTRPSIRRPVLKGR